MYLPPRASKSMSVSCCGRFGTGQRRAMRSTLDPLEDRMMEATPTRPIGLLADPCAGQSPASHRDLVECPPVAALTTVMPDGSPPDVGRLVRLQWPMRDHVNTMRGFPKERNMRRDPLVTLPVLRPARQPLRYLEVRGTVVEMTEDGAAGHLDALASKYPGRSGPLLRGRDPGRSQRRRSPSCV